MGWHARGLGSMGGAGDGGIWNCDSINKIVLE